MRKGDDRDCAKVGLACDLQNACLGYINRVETERQAKELKEEVSRLQRALRVKEAMLDVMGTPEDE